MPSKKGFTLVEMMLVLFILAILMLLSAPLFKLNNHMDAEFIINKIVLTQYQAILNSEKKYYEDENFDLYFNRKGGVNMANTFHLDNEEIVVSLGTGRIYVKNER